MMADVNIRLADGSATTMFRSDKVPDECPICQHGIDARLIVWDTNNDDSLTQVLCQCPRVSCERFFIAYYTPMGSGSGQVITHLLMYCAPSKHQDRKFDDPIPQISPSFCDIWIQASEAESKQLSAICGMGFRKALEFLMKDYLCSLHETERNKIKGLPLSQCIDRYADDPRIKDCAKRAAWLGNDETHYLRKWEDKDLDDLKALIELTLHWISSEHLTKKYKDEMPATESGSSIT